MGCGGSGPIRSADARVQLPRSFACSQLGLKRAPGGCMFLDFIFELIGLVLNLWAADSGVRDRTILGESEAEKSSRRFVAMTCWVALGVLGALAALVWCVP